jgi:hypothetical protein
MSVGIGSGKQYLCRKKSSEQLNYRPGSPIYLDYLSHHHGFVLKSIDKIVSKILGVKVIHTFAMNARAIPPSTDLTTEITRGKNTMAMRMPKT